MVVRSDQIRSVAQSCPTLFCPMDCNHQASLSMGFYGQEYWNVLPCPTPGDLPYPGIKPTSLISPALAGRFFINSNYLGSPCLSKAAYQYATCTEAPDNSDYSF